MFDHLTPADYLPSPGVCFKRIFIRWFCAEKMAHKIIPTPPHHVRLAPEAVTAIRKQDEIEILVGLDERIHHEQCIIRRHVTVHSAVGEEELAF